MENFIAGSFRDAGGYQAFYPEHINREYTISDNTFLPLIEKASIKIGELNAFAELVPDVDQFIRLHVIKEATVSSRIEGTQTKMEEALLKEEEVRPERRNDWKEVNNYIEALNDCSFKMNVLPLSSRMLKSAHKLLLNDVRGEHKLPGEFRKSQNWIGGTSLNAAAFVPPVFYEVESLMGDLENFLHNDNTRLPHVMKIALAHYQFETIHPFLDGNGRIGRLMITLYFIHAGILSKPVLYLSDFFERNRVNYYDNLMAVRQKNDLDTWLKFFLSGIIETSEKATSGLRKIVKIKNDCEHNRLPELGRRLPQGKKVLDHLFHSPVIRPEEVQEITGLSMVSVYKLIGELEKVNILSEMTGNQRKRIYIFKEYVNIFDEMKK